MSRLVCGECFCPYGDDGKCGCREMTTEYKLPEPEYYILTIDHTWLSVSKAQYDSAKPLHRMAAYTAEEFLQTYQAGRSELIAAVRRVHAAKGRYHSQIAMCDLYDLCGLPNERPMK